MTMRRSVGQRTRRLALILDVGEEVLGGEGVEVVVRAQACRGLRAALRTLCEVLLDSADEGPDLPSELHGPADGVAVPERELAGDTRGVGHGHPVGADLRDAPRARAEDDDVAVHPRPQLVDHLLVQLADAPAGCPGLALEEHGVQAAVRDRPAARDRDDPRVAATLDDVRDPVPHDARLELRELVAWVGAREHAQHAFEDLARQRLERGGAADQGEKLVDRERLPDRHRDDLLGQHVERVAGHDRLLDGAVVHALDDDRRLEEVAPVLREDHPLAGLADLVTRPPDPLEAARDRGGALDLDDEVHCAHVDPELQAARRDERGEAPRLELLLDLEALLARDGPMVGPDELLAGELVEPLGEALREPAAVREHDRAAMLADELQDPRVDRGPDARPQLAAEHGSAGLLVLRQHLAEACHVLDGDDDLELQRLAGTGVDDRHVPAVARPAEEPGDGLERALGRAEADPLEGSHGFGARSRGAQPLEALEAERQVRAALRPRDRVDLVDDHLLDAAEDLAGLAREEEIQALGRGDEDVRRVADEVTPLIRGRVAGPAGDRDPRRLHAEPLRSERDPRKGGPEVALHVVGERLERGDVEGTDRPLDPALWRRTRLVDEAVQAPQERGEGLAAPGRCVDQRVAALADGSPPLRLGHRGGLERRLEPGPDGGPERRQGIVDARGHGTREYRRRRRFRTDVRYRVSGERPNRRVSGEARRSDVGQRRGGGGGETPRRRPMSCCWSEPPLGRGGRWVPGPSVRPVPQVPGCHR